jgi:hypothetical protein
LPTLDIRCQFPKFRNELLGNLLSDSIELEPVTSQALALCFDELRGEILVELPDLILPMNWTVDSVQYL